MGFVGPNDGGIPAKCGLGDGESVGLWFVEGGGA